MKICYVVIVLALSTVAVCLADEQAGNDIKTFNGRDISATLFLNNAYEAGDWGIVEICPNDGFVHGIEILFNPPGQLDETALNAVKLYCSTVDHHDSGYLTSATAPEGHWYGMRVCTEGFLTGFRAKVLEYQGVFTDDVAVQDYQAECGYGVQILEGIATQEKFNEGVWSNWVQCPMDTLVCGLQTRVESPQLADDDTAITDINLFCCPSIPSNATLHK